MGSIVDDYKAIGEAYHRLSDGWIPRLAEPAVQTSNAMLETTDFVISIQRKEILNREYGPITRRNYADILGVKPRPISERLLERDLDIWRKASGT